MKDRLRTVRYIGFLVVIFAYAEMAPGALGAAPPPPICEEVCSSSTHCMDECYINLMEYENGNAITCADYGTCDPAETPEWCGNYYCGSGETWSNCSADCNLGIGDGPTCGNSSCELAEDSRNCPSDCTSANSCGDHVCDLGETPSNCAGDCYQAGFCTPSYGCGGYTGSYICSGQRCVYAPGAQACDPALQGLDCPDPDMKCIAGVCTEVF